MYLFLLLIPLSFNSILLNEGLTCQERQNTIKFVPACPQNATEWFIAAENKNCSQPSEDCTEELAYHCVPNHLQNITLEICAPVEFIVFGHCVEYSFFGNTIQANHNTDCKTCPIYYKSNELYKYQECFNTSISSTISPVTSSVKEGKDNTDENITLPDIEQEKEGAVDENNSVPWIAAPIFIIIIIISVAFLLITFLTEKKRMKKRKDEEQPLLNDMESTDVKSSKSDEEKHILGQSSFLQKVSFISELKGSIDVNPEVNVNNVRDIEFWSKEEKEISVKESEDIRSQQNINAIENRRGKSNTEIQDSIFDKFIKSTNVYYKPLLDKNQFEYGRLILIFGHLLPRMEENAVIYLNKNRFIIMKRITVNAMILFCSHEVNIGSPEDIFNYMERGQCLPVFCFSWNQNVIQVFESLLKRRKRVFRKLLHPYLKK